MSKKKAKIYKTKIPPSHPGYQHPGIYKYDDPTDKRFYIWYNIMSAQIKTTGTLEMRCNQQCRISEKQVDHYVGFATISPDHPDYVELLEASTKYREQCFD